MEICSLGANVPFSIIFSNTRYVIFQRSQKALLLSKGLTGDRAQGDDSKQYANLSDCTPQEEGYHIHSLG